MCDRDVHTLILGTCEYVAIHGKIDFARVIKLRILNLRHQLGLSEWTQHMDAYKRKTGGSVSSRGRGAESTGKSSVMNGPQTKECEWPLEGGKCKEKDSSLEPTERSAVLSDLDHSPPETYVRLLTSRSIRK